MAKITFVYLDIIKTYANMTLADALEGISTMKYYNTCGYSYHGLLPEHKDLPFDDLNPSMQRGFIKLVSGVYKAQKMVYCYDIEYLTHYIKDIGIQIKCFYDRCEINKTFCYHRNIDYQRDFDRLMRIRTELIKILIRLIDYVVK